MSPDNISSKSDDGLMGSVKEETDTSDESEADAAGEEDKVSNDMIGRYVSQGYENPSFGFAIALPDTYTLEIHAEYIAFQKAQNEYNEHGGVRQHKEFEHFVRAMIANAVEMALFAED